MERMKRLQEEREDEEASQEEMTTRFEKEKKESLFVVSGDTFHSFPHSGAFSVSLFLPFVFAFDFPGSSDNKESACNAKNPGSIPGSGRSLLFLEPCCSQTTFNIFHMDNGMIPVSHFFYLVLLYLMLILLLPLLCCCIFEYISDPVERYFSYVCSSCSYPG